MVGVAFIYHYFVLGYGAAESAHSIVGYAREVFFMGIFNSWQQVVDAYLAGRGCLVKTFRSFGV